MHDDPKFRALLLRREQGEKPPARLWPDGEAAPLDGILTIHQWHRSGRITFKEWLRYVREWAENVAVHYGSSADVERVQRVPKPLQASED
jgi:hypothetical protein